MSDHPDGQFVDALPEPDLENGSEASVVSADEVGLAYEDLAAEADDLVYLEGLSPAEAAEVAALEVDPDAVVGGPAFAETSTAAKTWALFTGIALIMVGNGLQGVLLGVRSSNEGFGIGVTGLVMTCYFIGFLFGTSYAERALASVGHIRVFAALASTASSAALVHAVSVTPVTWAIMRFVFGLCMAGLYVVAESWLNDLATNSNRGRLLSIYMVVTMAGMASGQFLLNVADPNGFGLFVLASVLVSLALVPMMLSAASAPPLRVPERITLRELVAIVPTGAYVSFFGGASAGTLVGLGAVYASAVGMDSSRIPIFLAAPLLGGLVMQWPIGRISDKVPRRGVMVVVASVATVVSLALVPTAEGSWIAVGLMFLIGGTNFPLYSLGIAHTNDWLPYEKILGAAALLVRVNGMGAVVGPVAAALMMALVDPVMFFWVLVATHAAVAVFIGYRIVFAEAVPVDDQRRFQAWPARASQLAVHLIPRRRRRIVPDSMLDTEPGAPADR